MPTFLNASLRQLLVVLSLTGMFVGQAVPARAQATTAGPASERLTFEEAVRRALEKNPTIAEAATAILRAEALLQQAQAAARPNASVSLSNALINRAQGFEGIVTQPRNQLFISGNLSVPILAASQWAAANQARDQIDVARLSTGDVRRQIAVAVAEAYLTVVALTRQVEVIQVAQTAAQAHLDYAERRLAAGAGSRLNELRAAQEVSGDEARLETAQLAVRRSQEALGVLVAADGPVDVNGEPTFDVPAVPAQPAVPAPPGSPGLPAQPAGTVPAWMADRTDVKLTTAAQQAAERVVRDSSKDWFPSVVASLDPQAVTPSGAFSPSASWRFTVTASQPIFDSGERRALLRLREAALESSRQSLIAVQIQARSEVRRAEDSVRSTERVLTSLRLSAQQAEEVVTITNTAFEAGATTNIELIDAQRSARDARTAVTIAEDAVRRAKLDLLTALGRFPQP